METTRNNFSANSLQYYTTSSTHQNKEKLEEVASNKKSNIGFKDSTALPPPRMNSKSQALCVAFAPPINCQPTSNSYAGRQIIHAPDFRSVHARKLKALKRMLTGLEDGFQTLLMIDDIQRLGIDHHFRDGIDAILEEQYDVVQLALLNGEDYSTSLHETSLRFRLLRQQGFPISAEIFGKLMDEEGKFMCNPIGDINGLMALHEASQMSTRGEDLLDEARSYSYKALNSIIRQVDYGQTTLVRETLKNPHHKSLAKFTSRNFMENYLPVENGWGRDLKGLANLEFKMVQAQHKQEIVEISRWWKGLGLSKELKFARDQPLKWYMWTVTCLTDPKLSQERIHLTKPISFIYLIDDIFDVYGQPHELVLFTDIVNRWDMSAADNNLPDEMKICFKALDKITNEISHWVYKTHGWDPTESLHKAWASLCNAFLVEARWFASGHLPSSEEYLKNGIISSGVHVALLHIFFLLGQGITKQNVELVENINSGIISSPASILRLWDDLGNAKDEDQNGHDGSYLECYMNENRGSSLEEARERVTHLISESWKQLNEECLSPSPYPSAFTNAALNLARTVPLMYSYDHNRRLSSLEENINSLLFEDVSR